MVNRIRDWPWRAVALCLLLSYPVMAIKWLPFGGGARYLNVLAGPISLLLLWQMPRDEMRSMLASAWHLLQPFMPFVVAWTFAQIWHGYVPVDLNPLTRLAWCALLFIGARCVGVSYRHLAWAAIVGATIYGVVGCIEVYWQGRSRAWGGTYENRFGQYATWLAVLVGVHLVHSQKDSMSRSWKVICLGAAALGVFGVVLSGSRGALLGLLVLAPIAISQAMSRKQIWLSLAAAMVALLIFAAIYPPLAQRTALIYRESWEYFDGAEFVPTSIGIRLELYRVALMMLLEHPLLGPGYTSLQQLYATHPSLGSPSPEMLAIPGFHNDWSQAIGVGGGSLLAAFLLTVGWLVLRSRGNGFRQAFVGCALVFSISEIFFADKLGLTLLMVSWALYSAADLNQQEQ